MMEYLLLFLPKLEQIQLQAGCRFFYDIALSRAGPLIKLQIVMPLYFPGDRDYKTIERHTRFILNENWREESRGWYSIQLDERIFQINVYTNACRWLSKNKMTGGFQVTENKPLKQKRGIFSMAVCTVLTNQGQRGLMT